MRAPPSHARRNRVLAVLAGVVVLAVLAGVVYYYIPGINAWVNTHFCSFSYCGTSTPLSSAQMVVSKPFTFSIRDYNTALNQGNPSLTDNASGHSGVTLEAYNYSNASVYFGTSINQPGGESSISIANTILSEEHEATVTSILNEHGVTVSDTQVYCNGTTPSIDPVSLTIANVACAGVYIPNSNAAMALNYLKQKQNLQSSPCKQGTAPGNAQVILTPKQTPPAFSATQPPLLTLTVQLSATCS